MDNPLGKIMFSIDRVVDIEDLPYGSQLLREDIRLFAFGDAEWTILTPMKVFEEARRHNGYEALCVELEKCIAEKIYISIPC